MDNSEPENVPSGEVVRIHDALVEAKALNDYLLLDYRCSHPKHCLLLDVWSSPLGRLYYLPRYQLKADKSLTETVESARLKRTEDGERKWPAAGGSIDYLLDFFADEMDANGLPLNCHHLRRSVSCAELAADLAVARRGRPTRRLLSATP